MEGNFHSFAAQHEPGATRARRKLKRARSPRALSHLDFLSFAARFRTGMRKPGIRATRALTRLARRKSRLPATLSELS